MEGMDYFVKGDVEDVVEGVEEDKVKVAEGGRRISCCGRKVDLPFFCYQTRQSGL